jgi:pimeloyl-ACP methyl ester carboxylesterase
MKKIFQVVLTIILNIVLFSCATTPDLHVSVEQKGVKPLTELVKLKIGGVDQWLLIRSSNPANPVFFFIHGGPGAAEMPLLRHYNYGLEKYFTVVMWDQRGAGKSNSRRIPAESINMDQLLDDTHEVTSYLKNRFKQEKIFLSGHSLGTVLGIEAINKYPGDYYAFVGIGQVVDMKRNIETSYELSKKLADSMGKKRDIRFFSGMHIDGKYNGGTDLEKAIYMRDWIAKNGRIYYDRHNLHNLVKIVLTAPEYSIVDKVKYLHGMNRSRKLLWTPELFEINFFKDAAKLEVPVYFINGKYDYLTSRELTLEYFNYVDAPEKHLFDFEYSAHCGIFEEAQKFNSLMVEYLLKYTNSEIEVENLAVKPGNSSNKSVETNSSE